VTVANARPRDGVGRRSKDTEDLTATDAVEARKRGDLAALLDLLAGTDQATRWAAAQQLGKLGDPAAVAPLIRRLDAADDGLRVSAIRALAAIGEASAVPSLVEAATGDPASGVRVTAIEALALMGDPRGGEMLAMLAIDPSSVLGTSQRRFEDFPGDAYDHIRRWAMKRLRELRPIGAIEVLAAARPRSLHHDLRLRWLRWLMRSSRGVGGHS
jgi:HEAT repeats